MYENSLINEQSRQACHNDASCNLYSCFLICAGNNTIESHCRQRTLQIIIWEQMNS